MARVGIWRAETSHIISAKSKIYPFKANRKPVTESNGYNLMNMDGNTRDIEKVRSRLLKEYNELKSWELVARHYGLTKAEVWKVATKKHEPKRVKIRNALGLPPGQFIVVINGEVPPGAQSIGAMPCLCGQHFIPNHPRRRACFICSPYRGHK